MVDPIEVKLDEMDAKIDQIAYASKTPRYYEISGEGKMAPPGGVKQKDFFGDVVKTVTSGLFTKITAGVAAGIIIVDLLKGILHHSKILSRMSEGILQALGTVLDMILIPLIPIMVWFIMRIYDVAQRIATFLAPVGGAPLETPGAQKGKEAATVDVLGLKIDIPSLAAGIAGALVGGIIGAIVGGGLGAVIGGALGGVLSVAITNWAYEAGAAFMEGISKLSDPMKIVTIVGGLAGGIMGAIVGGLAGSLLGPAGTAFGVAAGAIIGSWITNTLIDSAYKAGQGFRGWLDTNLPNIFKSIQNLVFGAFNYIKDKMPAIMDSIITAALITIPVVGPGLAAAYLALKSDSSNKTTVTNNTTTNNNGFNPLGMIGSITRSIYEEGQRILDSRYTAGG